MELTNTWPNTLNRNRYESKSNTGYDVEPSIERRPSNGRKANVG